LILHNKDPSLTAIPLRSIATGELGRYLDTRIERFLTTPAGKNVKKKREYVETDTEGFSSFTNN